MFIQTEATPNPRTIKFIPGVPVGGARSADFADAQSTAASPLARRLFALPEVRRVFLGADFVSVTLSEASDWELAKPAVLGAVMEHFVSGAPTLEAEPDAAGDVESGDGASDAVGARVAELLDTYVRPAVTQDGGDIVFRGFKEGVVYLHLQGACAGCPSSTATLKMGIERLLRHHLPEVTEVRAVA